MSLTRPQAARAWVNFNGTGTVAISSSFNVSSITDNGVGDYTVNFDQAMSNANYAFVIGRSIDSSPYTGGGQVGTPPTTTAFRFAPQRDTSGTNLDTSKVSVVIFGDAS